VALAVIEGPARGQVFRLTKARNVLGRSGADIVLYDPEVSRKHCMIEVRGSTATLIDLGTTNGTFVAGKSITTCQLEHLSKFRIGVTSLLFTVTDNKSGESAPPPTLVVRSRR
jgi:pSer/pThr/pTyr-binding forkhead associated (FHA) protein